MNESTETIKLLADTINKEKATYKEQANNNGLTVLDHLIDALIEHMNDWDSAFFLASLKD
jgi:hypothetical protein